jgi:hypothetical protein
MKRPPPSINASQAKSIADYSKQKTLSDASCKRAESIRRESEQSHAMWQHEVKRNEKVGKWISRVVICPIAFIAIWGIFIAISGLWTGELPSISRYSKVPHVFRISEPIYFWISFVVHSVMSGLFAYMSVRLIGTTGWLRAPKT